MKKRKTDYLTIDGKTYLVCRHPSIFVSRREKEDCTLSERTATEPGMGTGRLERDGYRYQTVAVFACESGEQIRCYANLKKIEDIVTFLENNGFIDVPQLELTL